MKTTRTQNLVAEALEKAFQEVGISFPQTDVHLHWSENHLLEVGKAAALAKEQPKGN